jgi:predicted metal-dependent phosphoesterase TrpH
MASELGLAAVAITDHDTTAGVREALEASVNLDIEVVAGVEISTDNPRCGSMHLLGYFIDPGNPELLDRLEDMVRERDRRNVKILDKLRSAGCPLEWDEVMAFAGGEVMGRPHIARAMMQRGYVASVAEAFERYLARGKPAYVERVRMLPGEAMERIRQAGGVPVLAHPGEFGLAQEELEEELKHLLPGGLGGVEVYYPSHTPEATRQYIELANRLGLAQTGGTDFHGASKPEVRLGSLDVPASLLEPLRVRATSAV